MNTRRLIFLLIIIGFSNISVAEIGYGQMELIDPGNGKKVRNHILYPANEKGSDLFAWTVGSLMPPQSQIDYDISALFKGFKATPNAVVTAKEAPIYFFFGDISGPLHVTAWLAAKLAENDSIVVMSDWHQSSGSHDWTGIHNSHTPIYGKHLVDSVLQSNFARHIDKNQIYAIGIAYGAYPALALSGFKFDFQGVFSNCAKVTEKNHQKRCHKVNEIRFKPLKQYNYKDPGKGYRDSRIKATILLEPNYTKYIQKTISPEWETPILMINTDRGHDKTVSIRDTVSFLPKSNKIKNVTIESAWFGDIYQQCLPDAIDRVINGQAWYGNKYARIWCTENSEKSREEIHDEIFENIIDFIDGAEN